jgi:hypothetical protein
MHADQLTNPRANVQTFERFHLPTFHSSNLHPSPVSHGLSPSSIVNRPRSILNVQTCKRSNVSAFQPSIFNLQLSTDCI